MTYTKVYVALGANLPFDGAAPEDTLRAALAELARRGARLQAVSRFYRTPCFPAGAGPDYVNAAAVLSGPADPAAALALLHGVEDRFGRSREERWGRRTLDIDLLGVGAAVHPDAETYAHWRDLPAAAQRAAAPDRLILPHPRMHERAFVLVPLADIAPDWRHPVTGARVADMAAALPPADRDAVIPM